MTTSSVSSFSNYNSKLENSEKPTAENATLIVDKSNYSGFALNNN